MGRGSISMLFRPGRAAAATCSLVVRLQGLLLRTRGSADHPAEGKSSAKPVRIATCPEVDVEGVGVPRRAADAGGVPRRAALRVLQHVPRGGSSRGVPGETLPQRICRTRQAMLLQPRSWSIVCTSVPQQRVRVTAQTREADSIAAVLHLFAQHGGQGGWDQPSRP